MRAKLLSTKKNPRHGLPDNGVALVECPHLHSLGDLELLKLLQVAEQTDIVEKLCPVLHAALPRRHHDLAEGVAVEEPELAVSSRPHARSTGLAVQEGQLPKRPTGGILKDLYGLASALRPARHTPSADSEVWEMLGQPDSRQSESTRTM
jgi:hypothetical protein